MFHDMGLGKTRTALEIYKYYRQATPALKLMVVCPLSLINAAWGEDIGKFTPYKYQDLHKNKTPDMTNDIFVINYEALMSLKVCEAVHNISMMSPTMCVLDESSKIKNHKAKTTKIILSLRDNFKYRLIMSATPAPNSEMEYWSQMCFVNEKILSRSFYKFRNEFFHLGRGGQTMIPNGSYLSKGQAAEIFKKGWKYEITEANKARLIARISPYCHMAKKDECLDLPETITEKRLLPLRPKQKKAYADMARHFVCEILGQNIAAQQALTKIMKLRQITSGFLINAEGKAVDIGENPKLKELIELLEQAGNRQVTIWAQFHHEIRTIKKLLGDRAVTMYGETSDKDAAVDAFKKSEAQYLIAHPHSAGHGLTFTNCSLQVFYSLDYSHEYHEQARGRIHRAGQLHKCTYIYLLCEGTIDESIYKVLKDKKHETEILEDLLRGRGNLKASRTGNDQTTVPRRMGVEN